MWKWKEGARGAVEKKNGVQDIPLLLLKETPEFKRFLCIVRNWPIILTGLAPVRVDDKDNFTW